ncbi:MAG: outer membrane protein assembly factor BamE [Gammaproteobacteria bacterium]
MPFVYRIDIQQGNSVDQKMIDKLRPGMDKNQVRFILGTPLISDPFHPERWDYLYSMEPGGDERSQRHITLHFNNDKLKYITGDVKASASPQSQDQPLKEPAVMVPLEQKKQGFFSRLFGTGKVRDPKIQIDKEKAETLEEIRKEADSDL